MTRAINCSSPISSNGGRRCADVRAQQHVVIASQVWPLAIEKCDGGHHHRAVARPRGTSGTSIPVPLALNWTASRATLNVTIAALALGTLPSRANAGSFAPRRRAVTAPASP